MSRGVKTTCFDAPGGVTRRSGVSIEGAQWFSQTKTLNHIQFSNHIRFRLGCCCSSQTISRVFEWLHPRSLTARPWKMMGLEDDPASYWVSITFPGRTVKPGEGRWSSLAQDTRFLSQRGGKMLCQHWPQLNGGGGKTLNNCNIGPYVCNTTFWWVRDGLMNLVEGFFVDDMIRELLDDA